MSRVCSARYWMTEEIIKYLLQHTVSIRPGKSTVGIYRLPARCRKIGWTFGACDAIFSKLWYPFVILRYLEGEIVALKCPRRHNSAVLGPIHRSWLQINGGRGSQTGRSTMARWKWMKWMHTRIYAWYHMRLAKSVRKGEIIVVLAPKTKNVL